MLRSALSLAGAGAVVAGVVLLAADRPALGDPIVERGVIEFEVPVWVQGELLEGRYVIEHDFNRMARGEPCTYIYEQQTPEDPQELAVAFHCTPRDRDGADRLTVVTDRLTSSGHRHLIEFQFPGSVEGHGVPLK